MNHKSTKLPYKVVRNDGEIWRRVYYNPDTKIQVAVVTCSKLHYEPDPDEPLQWGPYRVCFPHEHAGWSFQCTDIGKAEKYIGRQCTRIGRIRNALQFTLANKRLVPPGVSQ